MDSLVRGANSFLTCFVLLSFSAPSSRSWLLSEIEHAVLSELDFEIEGRNAERAAKNFEEKSKAINVKIPKIYWQGTTKAVLTMVRRAGPRRG